MERREVDGEVVTRNGLAIWSKTDVRETSGRAQKLDSLGMVGNCLFQPPLQCRDCAARAL
jgi:hypothetical protein